MSHIQTGHPNGNTTLSRTHRRLKLRTCAALDVDKGAPQQRIIVAAHYQHNGLRCLAPRPHKRRACRLQHRVRSSR